MVKCTLGNLRIPIADPLEKREGILIFLIVIIGIGQLVAIVNGIGI